MRKKQIKYPEFPDDEVLTELVRRCRIHFTIYITWEERCYLIEKLKRKPLPTDFIDRSDEVRWSGVEDLMRPSKLRDILWAIARKEAGDAVAKKLLGETV